VTRPPGHNPKKKKRETKNAKIAVTELGTGESHRKKNFTGREPDEKPRTGPKPTRLQNSYGGSKEKGGGIEEVRISVNNRAH